MKEKWKPIKGFEGYYEISNFGRVKSLESEHRTEMIRKQSLTRDGYSKVRLYTDSKDKTARVHRLVAEAFIPNFKNKETVNHKDGNKQNNNYLNLEWSDRSEQMHHAYSLNLKKPHRGSMNNQSKLTDEDVREIRKIYIRQSKEFGTVALSKKYRVSNRVIGLVVNFKSYKNVK